MLQLKSRKSKCNIKTTQKITWKRRNTCSTNVCDITQTTLLFCQISPREISAHLPKLSRVTACVSRKQPYVFVINETAGTYPNWAQFYTKQLLNEMAHGDTFVTSAGRSARAERGEIIISLQPEPVNYVCGNRRVLHATRSIANGPVPSWTLKRIFLQHPVSKYRELSFQTLVFAPCWRGWLRDTRVNQIWRRICFET